RAPTPFPYTTLFRSHGDERVQDEPSQGLAGRAAQAVQEDDGHRDEQEKGRAGEGAAHGAERIGNGPDELGASRCDARRRPEEARSEEHTSELQSLAY